MCFARKRRQDDGISAFIFLRHAQRTLVPHRAHSSLAFTWVRALRVTTSLSSRRSAFIRDGCICARVKWRTVSGYCTRSRVITGALTTTTTCCMLHARIAAHRRADAPAQVAALWESNGMPAGMRSPSCRAHYIELRTLRVATGGPIFAFPFSLFASSNFALLPSSNFCLFVFCSAK